MHWVDVPSRPLTKKGHTYCLGVQHYQYPQISICVRRIRDGIPSMQHKPITRSHCSINTRIAARTLGELLNFKQLKR